MPHFTVAAQGSLNYVMMSHMAEVLNYVPLVLMLANYCFAIFAVYAIWQLIQALKRISRSFDDIAKTLRARES